MLIVPRFQRAIHALDYVFALVVCVAHVVMGGYRVLTKHSIATWDYFVCHGDS